MLRQQARAAALGIIRPSTDFIKSTSEQLPQGRKENNKKSLQTQGFFKSTCIQASHNVSDCLRQLQAAKAPWL